MDRRRAAGALLALAACIACSAAAPTASNQTALDLYESAPEGCYYNFQHYGEGDRIMTNEPCLNCTCHNRMLMCYLRVCPFTKPIGQDCTVEKRADQCCPIVTCPDVPVDLLTSTSTTSPAEYGATGLGKLDKYGCSMNGKYFPEGSKVPPTPNKPCEHCYCIRNMTTCVMQECTLHVDGCTPIYHKDVCCPVRYSCDHPEDEIPLLDDMSTTVRPTPGFLLTTTTASPVTQMTQDCVHNDRIIADGASITTEKACEHCYCMKGDIVCVVQECGAPMENEGKNCTSLAPRAGQCCPDTYICEGDEINTELNADLTTESATSSVIETLTTLSPPRRTGIEGSGYRNEPNEAGDIETATSETEFEGSGEELEIKPTDAYETLTPGKPLEPQEMTPVLEDQYIPVTAKTTSATVEDFGTTTKEVNTNVIPDENLEQKTIEPDTYQPTTHVPIEEDIDKKTTAVNEEDEYKKPHEQETVGTTSTPETYEKGTTDLGESVNTILDIAPEQEDAKKPTDVPVTTETEVTKIAFDNETTMSSISEGISEAEHPIISSEILGDKESTTTVKTISVHEQIETLAPTESAVTSDHVLEDKETSKPELYVPSSTVAPIEEVEKLTTEPDHALNTVAVNEEGYDYPHPTSGIKEKPTPSDDETSVTEKVTKESAPETQEYLSTQIPTLGESEVTTAEPDKGLNTIPSEPEEESSSQSAADKTTLSFETKTTEASAIVDSTEQQEIEVKSPTTTISELSSEALVTKGDLYTITTEPSFRREDDTSATTIKSKDEYAQTTIKPEFVDEGLIPTSTHDEKLSTGSDASFDEDITTIIPEYIQELEETKKSTTERTSSVASESFPEKGDESTSGQEGELSITTEKLADVDSHDEPSRIPGEGDCLLSGVTYRNNSIVPSTNNCHTGCRCVSSIIKCDPIICSPQPDYMDNCQSIYDTPESCCPTYVCDHPKETIPPQSDNQMSGTEPPMPPPIIECHGDQCELSQPTKPPTYETSDCSADGCGGDAVQKPVTSQSTVEKPDLTHSQVPPGKPCEGDNCEVIGEEPLIPQPCQNENDCKKLEVPVTQSVPCEGQSCTNVECGSSGCDPNAILSPQENQMVPCKEEDGCKPQETISLDCEGDLPCRRKDVTSVENMPSACVGSDCEQKTDTTVTLDINKYGTESPMLEQTPPETATEKEIDEKEKPEPTVSEEEKVDTTPITLSNTEKELVPTEQSIYETTELVKTEKVTEKTTDENIISTDEPILNVREGEETKKPDDQNQADKTVEKVAVVEETNTKLPDGIEEPYTDKPIPIEETATELSKFEGEPTNVPVVDDQDTKTTTVAEELTRKPALIVEDVTTSKVADVGEIYTERPASVEPEDSKMPDQETKLPDTAEEHTDKPVLTEKDNTNAPGTTEEQTYKPILVDGETTKMSDVAEQYTDKPGLIEKEILKVTDITEGPTDKPITTKEVMKLPEAGDQQTDKPAIAEIESTKIPDIYEQQTVEPASVEKESTKIPDIAEEQTSKPAFVEKEDEYHSENENELTAKPISVEEESTKAAEVTEEYTYKPALAEIEPTKVTDSVEHSDKKDEEGSKTTLLAEEYTNKPTLAEEEGTKPAVVFEDYTDKPAVVEEGTTLPNILEENTDKPAFVEALATKMPDIVEEHTDKPEFVEAEGTKKPNIAEDYTKKPDLVDDIKITDLIKEHTDKPISVDEEATKIPDVVTDIIVVTENAVKEKPILVEEDLPDQPIITKEEPEPSLIETGSTSDTAILEEGETDNPQTIEDTITKKPVLIDEAILTPTEFEEGSGQGVSTDYPLIIDDKPDEKPSIIEEDTKKPIIDKELIPHLVEKEQTDEPQISEEKTDRPEISDQNILQTSVDKDTRLTETPEAMKTTYEPHTTVVEEHTKPTDISKPEVESSDVKITEPQETSEVQDKETHKVVTQPSTEQDNATEAPVFETTFKEILPPLREGEKETSDIPSEQSATSQEPLTVVDDATKMPELVATTEAVEKVSKSGQETVTAEGDTGIPEEDSSVTLAPGKDIIKPQEPSFDSTSPEKGETTTGITTNLLEENYITPFTPVSHVTDNTTESESLSTTPDKTSIIPEAVEVATQKVHLAEPQDSETEKAPPTTAGEQETKTHEQDEIVTTPETVKVPDVEDSSVTGKDDKTTAGYELSTERLEPSATDKADVSSETVTASSELPVVADTKGPEESYTESQEAYTEASISVDTKPTDIHVLEPSEPTGKPLTEDQHQTTESSVSETKTPDLPELSTRLPVTVITDSQETPKVPDEDNIGQEETTIKTPETSKPEIHETEDQTATASTTESAQIDISKTTAIPEKSDKPGDIVTEEPEITHTLADDIGIKEETEKVQKSSTESPTTFEEILTEYPHSQASTEGSMSLVTESRPDVSVSEDVITEKQETKPSEQDSHTDSHEQITEKPEEIILVSEETTSKHTDEFTKATVYTSAPTEFSETTPYLIELEEHTHKMVEEISSTSPSELDSATTLVYEEVTPKTQEHISTASSSSGDSVSEVTTAQPEKIPEDVEMATKLSESPSSDELPSTISGPTGYQTTQSVPVEVSGEVSESSVASEPTLVERTTTPPSQEVSTTKIAQDSEETTPNIVTDGEKSTSESDVTLSTEKPASRGTTVPESEIILSTTKATTLKEDELLTPDSEDKYDKPEEKPTSEIVPPSTTSEVPKPPTEMQPTDEVTSPDEESLPPSGYGEPDYVEEDQAFGPGTCRYGGKVYVSAQQIPRDDPCDFCFCFRSDIICLQQSCPPPIHGCHEEPIQGFCCPRYECPVSMATTVNVTTTTTTTTTTLPPHFPTHSYKGAAQRRGCQIKGHTYKVGEVVRSSSGPCLHCTCGGDGQMKCDPKACTPEPMLRQMIAAAVSAKRRR